MTVVDADAHINEDVTAWRGLFEQHPGWIGAVESGGRLVAQIDGKPYPLQEGHGRGVPIDSAILPAAAPGAGDVHRRIKDCDDEGIDIQVLYGGLIIGLTGYRDPGFAADVARAYNDWLLGDVCAQYSDRLKAVAAVPLQNVGRAIAEMQYAVGKGAVAVTIPPVLGDRNLDDPALRPFFAAAADANIALGVHSAPGMNIPLPAAERFTNYAQVHLLSFPIDQMVAFTALALGGVLDEFPTLRFAFLEAGVGWVPFFLARAEEHREKRGDMLPGMTSAAKDYVERGQCYFSIECEDPFLEFYVEQLGADSVIFASDYPHWDADFPGTVDEMRTTASKLGDEVTAKVLGNNALRLYGLV
jgi:predicted TIM-barrel fold metal-dependent hydrolase